MKPFYLLIIILCLSEIVQGQDRRDNVQDILKDIDSNLEQLRIFHGVPGFALAIVKKDRIVYSKGFGYRNVEEKLPVTGQTVFPIGSCTKAFTATIVGQLEAAGKLSLDKPVTEYLPTLKFFNHNLTSQVTFRDLMSHRTGLPRHDASWVMFPLSSIDSLLRRLPFLEPSSPLRTIYQYNNFMFAVQGALVCKISGKSWPELVQEQIFKPLDMHKSTTDITAMQQNGDVALGYTLEKDNLAAVVPYASIGAMAPAGSINSNVSDLAKWVGAWINGGSYNKTQIIPAGFHKQAISAQIPMTSSLPRQGVPDVFLSSYGLGWTLTSYRGHYRVDHGGNTNGFTASISFFPTDSVGIIILSNQSNAGFPTIVRNLIADKLLALPYVDWNADNIQLSAIAKATAARNIWATPLTPGLSRAQLAQFPGVYEHRGYGKIKIFLNQGKLFANAGIETWQLEPISEKSFYVFKTKDLRHLQFPQPIFTKIDFDLVNGAVRKLSVGLESAIKPLEFELLRPQPRAGV